MVEFVYGLSLPHHDRSHWLNEIWWNNCLSSLKEYPGLSEKKLKKDALVMLGQGEKSYLLKKRIEVYASLPKTLPPKSPKKRENINIDLTG